MRVPTWIGWTAATTVGLSLGTTVSTLVVGATARPLSPLLGGIIFVLSYGVLIGIVIGLAQCLAIPRRAARWNMWILATPLGAGAGYALASVVGEILGNTIDPSLNVVIGEGAIETASGAVVGLGIGFAQWLVLRRGLSHGRWWIVASVVGGALGYGAAAAALELFDLPVLKANLVPSFGAILGLFVGVSQGLVLRPAYLD